MKVKCKKVEARIECLKCEYPYSEAAYPDDYDEPLDCDASDDRIKQHIDYVESLRDDGHNHHWDCLCLIHR